MITKLGMDIGKLRNFVSTKISPKLVRYGKNGRGLEGGENLTYHMPRNIGAVAPETRLTTARAALDRYVKHNPQENIPQEAVEAQLGNIKGMLGRLGLSNAPRKPHIQWGPTGHKLLRKLIREKPVGKIENQAFNDIVAHHENNEFLAGKLLSKSLKAKNRDTSFASHFHPDVLLKEHNLVSSLSGAPKESINNVRNTFRSMRDHTGETPFLDNFIPGGYGTGPRINRRYRKYLSDKMLTNIGQ